MFTQFSYIIINFFFFNTIDAAWSAVQRHLQYAKMF